MARVTQLAAAGALVGGLVLYPPAIVGLRRLGVLQRERQDGPSSHLRKAGTPTAGGVVFCTVLVVAWLLGLRGAAGGVVVGAGALGMAVGLFDDLTKVRTGEGVRVVPKFLLLAICAAVLGTGLALTGAQSQLIPVAGWRDLGLFGIALAALAVLATSNAVNLTDGVDGLAAGSAVPGFLALGLAAQLQGRSELAGTCWSVAAVLLAFLVFNRPRAKVFMGDAGSLALGLMLAVAAAEVGLLILLPLLAAVFLVETGSVILQVGYFRLTGGRRLFRMSPLHHHLEMGGLGEWAVDLRLWAASWVAGALALLWALATGLGGRPG